MGMRTLNPEPRAPRKEPNRASGRAGQTDPFLSSKWEGECKLVYSCLHVRLNVNLSEFDAHVCISIYMRLLCECAVCEFECELICENACEFEHAHVCISVSECVHFNVGPYARVCV